jgi:hypothetical protein
MKTILAILHGVRTLAALTKLGGETRSYERKDATRGRHHYTSCRPRVFGALHGFGARRYSAGQKTCECISLPVLAYRRTAHAEDVCTKCGLDRGMASCTPHHPAGGCLTCACCSYCTRNYACPKKHNNLPRDSGTMNMVARQVDSRGRNFRTTAQVTIPTRKMVAGKEEGISWTCRNGAGTRSNFGIYHHWRSKRCKRSERHQRFAIGFDILAYCRSSTRNARRKAPS